MLKEMEIPSDNLREVIRIALDELESRNEPFNISYEYIEAMADEQGYRLE